MLKQDHPYAPNIDLLVIVISLLNLGSHEVGTTAMSVSFEGLEISDAGHSEVDDSDA